MKDSRRGRKGVAAYTQALSYNEMLDLCWEVEVIDEIEQSFNDVFGLAFLCEDRGVKEAVEEYLAYGRI